MCRERVQRFEREPALSPRAISSVRRSTELATTAATMPSRTCSGKKWQPPKARTQAEQETQHGNPLFGHPGCGLPFHAVNRPGLCQRWFLIASRMSKVRLTRAGGLLGEPVRSCTTATIVAPSTGTIILALRATSELWCSLLVYEPKVLSAPRFCCCGVAISRTKTAPINGARKARADRAVNLAGGIFIVEGEKDMKTASGWRAQRFLAIGAPAARGDTSDRLCSTSSGPRPDRNDMLQLV